MTAAQIARVLGAASRSGTWWRCLCPVHGSRTGRSASLALRDGEHGLVAVCHAGCDRADVIAALRGRGLLGAAGTHSRPEPAAPRGDDAAERIAWARRIWATAREAPGSPVVRYLAGRGINIAPPLALRWVPSLRRPDGGSGPAMVARIDNIDGELIGVSRTWLARDASSGWRRCDRAMLGRASGGAVRLAPAADTLLVGEGIETCLAAMQATAQPAWAALSASGMMALALPPEVRTVIILADNDPNGAGKRAARTATQRWLAEGRRVQIAMPPEPGTDFNDMLTGKSAAQTKEAGHAA